MNRIRTIKALVVDDSAFNRSAISQMLAIDTGIEVVGTAIDGVDAIGKTLRLSPDVITLDLEMPNMDGFTFLRWLMKERPTPVLVISSRSDSRSVFRALELGAVDFLAKPEARISKSLEGIREELLMKVRAMPLLEMGKVRSTVDLLARERVAPAVRKDEETTPRKSVIEIVAIAASTGGPPALQAILSGLPGDLGAGIVISQHMPPGVPREPSDKYVPSADRMMASVAEACGSAVLGVVLTGMGNDGTAGALAIKRLNGQCIAESQESAVIFGMPQEVIRSGAVDKVLPLSRMADEISFRCSGRA
ncbi:MAG: cheB40H [Nitrospirae bacterium]|nr:cheB40H [Nitrospirota bacterium]